MKAASLKDPIRAAVRITLCWLCGTSTNRPGLQSMPAARTRSAARKEEAAIAASSSATRFLGFPEWVTFVWFFVDGFTHLSIELGYVLVALGPTARKSDSLMGFIWREYGRADARWAVRNATVISLELLTVFLVGPLCLWAAYAVRARKPYRHFLQIVISTAELYGGFMTFAPDILDGSPSLADRATQPLLFWVHLVFMNGVWVLIPLLLLWESGAHVIHACSVAKTEHQSKRDRVPMLPPALWFHVIAATLALYAVLVPLIIFVAADPPPAVTS